MITYNNGYKTKYRKVKKVNSKRLVEAATRERDRSAEVIIKNREMQKALDIICQVEFSGDSFVRKILADAIDFKCNSFAESNLSMVDAFKVRCENSAQYGSGI